MLKNKAPLSVAGRISVMTVLMVVLSSMFVGIYSYFLYRNESVEYHAQQAVLMAESIASAINPAEFDKAFASGEKTPYWHEIKRIIDNAKTRTGVEYLYILDDQYDQNVKYFMEGANLDGNELYESIDFGELETIDVHADEMFETIRTGESTSTGVYYAEEYGDLISGFAAVFGEDGRVTGVVGVDLNVNMAMSRSTDFGIRVIICVVCFCALFWVIATWYIRRSVGKPIKAVSAAAKKIALGDLNVALVKTSNDEIGELVSSFQEIADNTATQVRALEALADGDLTVGIKPRCDNDVMGRAMSKMLDNLNNIVGNISISADHVSDGSKRVADLAQSLAGTTAEQSSVISHLEESVSGISSRTMENTAMAVQAVELAENVTVRAKKGVSQMEEMTRAVKEINDASLAIGKVMRVIDDIAFQTNILALNASVEAARAGQHGKGFAVVADEVRNLAAKSSEASKDTGALIGSSIEKARLGEEIAKETAKSLDEIVTGINQSSYFISEIAKFSKEQSEAISDISGGMSQISNVIQNNSDAANESAAAGEEMNSQSTALKQLISMFNLKG